MTESTQEPKRRKRRTQEEITANLRERLATAESRSALKALAQLTVGQKILKATRLLASAANDPNGDSILCATAASALRDICDVLQDDFKILPQHLISLQEPAQPAAELPFTEEEPSSTEL